LTISSNVGFLSGGFSFFSGEYGLAADNVRSVELVLGNGTIVEASAQVNQDLFWALKGGGPNFGTSHVYPSYKAPLTQREPQASSPAST
jgi:FAD/FMN-containing dehydrogenase